MVQNGSLVDSYYGHGPPSGATLASATDLRGNWSAAVMPGTDISAAAFGHPRRPSTEEPSQWQPRDWNVASPDRIIGAGKALTEEDYREIDRGFLGASRAAPTNGGFVSAQPQGPWNASAHPTSGSVSDGFSRLASEQLNGSLSPAQFGNDGSAVMARRNGGLDSGWDLLPAHAPTGGFGAYGTSDSNGAANALWSFGSPGSTQEQMMWGAGGAGQQAQALKEPRWADVSPHRSSVEGDYGVGDLGGGLQVPLGSGSGSDGNGLHYLSRQPSAPAAPSSRSLPFQTNSVPYLHPQHQQQPQQPQHLLGDYPVNAGISGTASDPDVLGRQLASLGLASSDMLLPAIGFEEQQRQQHLIHLQLLAKQPPAMDVQQLQQGRHPVSPGVGMQGGTGNGVAGAGYGHLLGNGAGLDVNILRREGSVPAMPVRTLSDPSRVGPSYQQKPLYQQQPLQVMLRAQQVPRPMPMVRPPQRTVTGQSNVASLSIHDKRRQPVMPVKRLPKADVNWLSQQLTAVVDSLMPTSEECARQAAAFDKVACVLKARWPEGSVHLFGSTANCLSITNNNDIDVCLELPELPDEQAKKSEVVEEMARVLEGAGMRDVLPLAKARVPVVKCIAPETGTKVDVTLNNTLAIINTKLLADYCAIDGRLTQLAFIVKHWAKRRQVNDAYRGTLSSYGYVLMCIHLLQQRQPPVLPCLHNIRPHTHVRRVGQWDCDFYDKVGNLVSFGTANTETLGELVWAFFEYWAWKHDYNTAVVSVRTGGFLTKAQKEWTRRIGNERHLVSIEDPFELSHDLGRTVDRQTSMVLHKEFERAACILRDLPGGVDKLFEPYRAGKTE